MALLTKPKDSVFTCMHCGLEPTEKKLKNYKVKDQDMTLQACSKCKEYTLLCFQPDMSFVGLMKVIN